VEHVVFFPAPDGTPAFRRVSDFESAVRFVEHLRNVENVTGASVHTLTEVPLAFRAWYRVEMPNGATESAPLPAVAAVVPEPALEPTSVLDEHSIPFVEFRDSDDTGSATGILVADTSFPTSDSFEVSAAQEPFEFTGADLLPALEDAGVLEPAAGGRRDRGLGFFAR
jgi:hypothetical protein